MQGLYKACIFLGRSPQCVCLQASLSLWRTLPSSSHRPKAAQRKAAHHHPTSFHPFFSRSLGKAPGGLDFFLLLFLTSSLHNCPHPAVFSWGETPRNSHPEWFGTWVQSPDAVRESLNTKLGDAVASTNDSNTAPTAGHVDNPAPGFLDHGQHVEGHFNQSHQVHVDHLHKVLLGQPFIGTTGQAHTSVVHQGPEAWG